MSWHIAVRQLQMTLNCGSAPLGLSYFVANLKVLVGANQDMLAYGK